MSEAVLHHESKETAEFPEIRVAIVQETNPSDQLPYGKGACDPSFSEEL